MRSAKEAGVFPYKSKLVCYIAVDNEGNVSQVANSRAAILEACGNATKGSIRLYAVWPGQWRSDLFEIDDLDALAEAYA